MFNHIHIPIQEKEIFFKYYPIKELKEIDPFFVNRNFNNNEATIQRFFAKLIKKYKKFMDQNNEGLNEPLPIIFVLEDSRYIDEVLYNVN